MRLKSMLYVSTFFAGLGCALAAGEAEAGHYCDTHPCPDTVPGFENDVAWDPPQILSASDSYCKHHPCIDGVPNLLAEAGKPALADGDVTRFMREIDKASREAFSAPSR